MILNDTTLEFSTGRTIRTMDGIIGLAPEGWVCAGALESIYDPRTRHTDEPLYLTPEERAELGEYMAQRWLEFAGKAKEQK